MRYCNASLVLVLFAVMLSGPAGAQDSSQTSLPGTVLVPVSQDSVRQSLEKAPGDRILLKTSDNGSVKDALAVAGPIGKDYPLGPGDVLNITVTGRANLKYHVNQTASNGNTVVGNPDETTITPDGKVILPVAGPVEAAGKTVAQLQETVKQALAEYYKNFEVNISVSKPRTMKVFVNGAVSNPGAQVVPGTATLMEVLLTAGIEPGGSTRRVELRRDGTTRQVDLYSAVMKGQLDENPALQAGDVVYVPAVSSWVEVNGEVTRPGKYELLPGSRLSDVIDLAMGFSPAAVPARATVERPGAEGVAETLHPDAEKAYVDPKCADNVELAGGDKIRIPALSEYMPMIRLVGEFVGKGVFQRVIGQGEEQVLNKSGVLLLAQGKTVGEVIRETGGVTPQADLRHGRIQRRTGDKTEEIALDLERLLMQNDAAADVVLRNGDIVILPALPDKVHIMGSVVRPGAYAYAPNRRLMDYIGDAGGEAQRGWLSRVKVIRGDPKNPIIKNCDLTKGITRLDANNPVLEPGDVVFVAERDFDGWRDAISLLTTLRFVQTMLE